MPTVDRLVLSSLGDWVFTEERVHKMLRELKDGRIHSRQDQQIFLKQLGAELEKNRNATDRLYEAVEAGLLPKDATLTERAQKLQARRQEILTEIAGIKREADMPENMLSSQNVRAFCNAMRERLADPGSGFGKQYLRLLVKEIQVTGKEIRMWGSYEALGHAIAQKNLGTPEGVPRFVPAWRAPSERIRTASEIPIEVDLTDEDAIPVYMKIFEKVLHLSKLGMSFPAISDRLGVNLWTAKKAARRGNTHH